MSHTDKISYRIDEAVKASGLGRSFLYERMAEGKLRSVKIGGRRLIMRKDLLAFLDGGDIETPPVQVGATIKPASAVKAARLADWSQLELPLKARK